MRTEVPTPAGLVIEIEVTDQISAVISPRVAIEALILIRFMTEPIGMLYETLTADGLTAAELAAKVTHRFSGELRTRFAECGLVWTGELPVSGLTPRRATRFVKDRERIRQVGPSVTAVVCTSGRPETLRRTLESLTDQEYPGLDVLVVNNDPRLDSAERLTAEFANRCRISYSAEPRRGLSWARNHAIERAEGDVIAWVDDDEYCDRWWASEIARGYVEVPQADAVTGTVMPSELETSSQLFFDKYGGTRRARGFSRHIFSTGSHTRQSPLQPSPPFGIGANMSFRREALKLIGGFDCALGAGTRSRTGEDIAALSTLLLKGGTIVYQPTSIVYHRNRRDQEELSKLLLGHGRGLGAFYTSMLLHQPNCLPEVLRIAPQALLRKRAVDRERRRLSNLDASMDDDLLRAHRIGLLQGPIMYALAKLDERRQRAVPTR